MNSGNYSYGWAFGDTKYQITSIKISPDGLLALFLGGDFTFNDGKTLFGVFNTPNGTIDTNDRYSLMIYTGG